MDELQLKELQDQLEAEQYFSSLYKTQVKELKEELEERQKIINDLEEEKYYNCYQTLGKGLSQWLHLHVQC